MSTTCKARFHMGDDVVEWEGVGIDEADAFTSAATSSDVGPGALPSPANRIGGLNLLKRFGLGARPEPGKYLTDAGAHLSLDDDGYPLLEIGWVRYTFSHRVKLWAITAQVSVLTGAGWDGSRQVPTFYLDPAVQGIVDRDHAARIAEDILFTSAGDAQGVTIAVHAEPIY